MEQARRTNIAFGVILLLLGVWFLVVQLVPGIQAALGLQFSWPLIVVGVGVAFLLFGILAGVPGFAIPACIIAGIGGILYWQNATENYASWAYAWTLIPGFVGIGIILMGLLGQATRRSIADGAWLVVISLVLFFVFGSFWGGLNILGPYWPVLLIVFGVWLLVRSMFRYKWR